MHISSESVVARSKNTLFVEIDGEIIILGEGGQKYYGINGTAMEIWRKIDNPISVSELLIYLSKKYQKDLTEIEDDVISFLNYLEKNKSIEIFG